MSKFCKKIKLVIVEWQDAVMGHSGWKWAKDTKFKTAKIYSVGYLIVSNKKHIVLCSSMKHPNKKDGDLSIACDVTIPKDWIISIRELIEVDK